MGRKPNPLILAHFHRGPKLEDASNRYQYTCKACAAHFPKGRMDSLVAHLTNAGPKRCRFVTDEESARVLGYLNEKTTSRPARGTDGPVAAAAGLSERGGRGASGGDLGGEGGDGGGTGAGSIEGGIKLAVGGGRKLTGLEALAEASRQVERPLEGEEGEEEDDGGVIDPSLKDYERRIQNELATSIGYAGIGSPPSVQDLSSIAASASNLEASMPQSPGGEALLDVVSSDRVDGAPGLGTTGVWTPHMLHDVDGAATKMARAATYPRAIAAYPDGLSRSFRKSGEPSLRVQKVRGKFTDTRRMEVREVRKKGACLRCKMLRKTCSDGDPCATCAKLESARLWKTPCMRIRLAQAYEHYLIDFYENLTSNGFQHISEHYQLQARGNDVIVCHLGHTGAYLSHKALVGNVTPEYDGVDRARLQCPVALFDFTNGSFGEDLEKLIEVELTDWEDEDLPDILRRTLRLASKLSKKSTDTILPQSILLWNLNQILVSSRPLITLYHSPEPPTSTLDQAKLTPLTTSESTYSPLSLSIKPEHVLVAQLLRAIQERASRICKSVLNDLEKRLLRGRFQGFDIFLAAFLVLSCVERMEWFARRFEMVDGVDQFSSGISLSKVTTESKTFATFLCDLLKQRHVVPDTCADPTTGVVSTTDDTDENTIWWFSGVKLTEHDLREWRDNTAFDPTNPACYDMRYCALLLCPKGDEAKLVWTAEGGGGGKGNRVNESTHGNRGEE